jgi:hypothetical protein
LKQVGKYLHKYQGTALQVLKALRVSETDLDLSQHWATTRSVLSEQPPGQQANKQQSTNTPKKLAVLMAAVVHRYNTVRIAQ